MYLARGQQISEPHHADLKPGQLLLFNPEILHSTQVNVSDRTRVALTTRVNPHAPRFNDEAPFNFEHWHNSRDLERRRFKALDVFPARKHRGSPSHEARPKLDRINTLIITAGHALAEGAACASSDLQGGVKVAVDFTDAKVILWREASGEVKAYSRLCPHVGVDLADGWHNSEALHCPGHGLRFSWRDGRANCDAFRLAAFTVEERGGMVYLRRAGKRETADAACAASA